MKQKLFLAILLLSCIKVQAQSKYKKGFIITHKSDTIHGFILDNPNITNPKNCLFKSSLNDLETNYTPNNLTSFQFDHGNKYITFDHQNKKGSNERVFALVIEEGRINLYHNKSTYFVQKQQGKIIKLENDKIEVTENSISFKKESKRYIGILIYLTSDFQQLRPQIKKLKYLGKNISELISKYNLKFDTSNQKKTKSDSWNKIEYAAYVSTSFSKPNFPTKYNPLLDQLANANWDISQQFGLGFFIENQYTKILKNTAVHIEAHLQRITYTANSEPSNNGTEYVFNNQLEHFALDIPLGIKYYHSIANIKGYIMGGVYYKKTFAHNDKTSSLKKMNNNIFIQPEVESYEPISNKIGLWFSLGVRKKINNKLDLFSEIRYSQNESKTARNINRARLIEKHQNINIGLHIGLYF